MANAMYPKAKEKLWQGQINLATADVKAVLVDLSDYTYSAAHEFLSSVPVAARVGTSPNLAGKTFTDGVFDANDTTATAVSGDPLEAVILYVDTGDAATSPLITYLDTGPAPGNLPISFTPNGSDVLITWAPAGIQSL